MPRKISKRSQRFIDAYGNWELVSGEIISALIYDEKIQEATRLLSAVVYAKNAWRRTKDQSIAMIQAKRRQS